MMCNRDYRVVNLPILERRVSKNSNNSKQRFIELPVPHLLAFFVDRLKVYLRDKGARHDLIDAVFALPGQDDLLMIVRRVEALGSLLDSDDGKNLFAGYRRAANILRAEEKKDAEGAFARARRRARSRCRKRRRSPGARRRRGPKRRSASRSEDFEGAMRALAALRAPVDEFFLRSPSTPTIPSCGSIACACSANCATRCIRSRIFPRSPAARAAGPAAPRVSGHRRPRHVNPLQSAVAGLALACGGGFAVPAAGGRGRFVGGGGRRRNLERGERLGRGAIAP